MKTDGVKPTIDSVLDKLINLAFGYCNAGEVSRSVVVSSIYWHRVVSNGNHAEFVNVPVNLR